MGSTPSPSSCPAMSVRTYRGVYESHSHSHAQVLMGLQGGLQLEIDGHSAFVDPSCGVVIPAGSHHGYLAESRAQVLVIDCDAAPGVDRLRRFALSSDWHTRLAVCNSDSLLRHVTGAPSLQARRRLELAELAMAVDAELHRGWTVAQMATVCHFSPQRFRARFSEVTGMTPLAWVRQRRLEAAERLLRSGVPLETTALQVGYASASALCFALRRDRDTGARRLRAAAV
jgi:AraC-like DNA-binding protein